MPKHLIIPSEQENMLVTSYLTLRSTPFTVEPLPDGEYQVSIKDEVFDTLAKWLAETRIKVRVLQTEQVVPIIGLNESQQARKGLAALEERNHIDYQCYMLLQEFIDGGKTIGEEEFKSFTDRAREFCRMRRESNDRFVRLACVRKEGS
jgi:hypothetical protein